MLDIKVNVVDKNEERINLWNDKNLENLQNTSKFYRADATVFLPPEHRTTHLFLTKELGVEESLIKLKGMTQGMLVILGQKNIKKLVYQLILHLH